MNKILEKIGELGIVPVIKIEKAEDALPLGRALLDGYLPIAEITFRTPAAEESIKTLIRELPELLVGAGTVLTVEQIEKAVSAGAQFIVSPGFNPQIVDYCLKKDIVVIPGLNNPTQIEMAQERGLEVVKYFPAEASGGLALLEAISEPFSGIKYIPTGGINQHNLLSYLSNSKVHACGGSWMVKPELLTARNFSEITRLTRDAVFTLLGFQLIHLGINEENKDQAIHSANLLAHIFSLPIRETEGSFFVGTGFEVMKTKFLGEHGHIAMGTNHIHRAITFLKSRGISILPETAKEDEQGKLRAVYLDQEISGFAIHLLQK